MHDSNTAEKHQQFLFGLQHALLVPHGAVMGHANVRADLSFLPMALVKNAQNVAPPRSLQVNAHPPRTLCVVRTSIISNAIMIVLSDSLVW